FGAAAESFMQDYAKNHRTRGEMQRMINIDLAEWHDRQISEITRGDIKELLRRKTRTAPIQANRLKALVSKNLHFGVERGNHRSVPRSPSRSPRRFGAGAHPHPERR